MPLLLSLNSDKGWWTVGSQPAVDGISSEDAVYGFGPRGGYVFQKAFVEFFVTEEVVNMLATKADKLNGIITFYAGNKRVRGYLLASFSSMCADVRNLAGRLPHQHGARGR